MSASANGQTDKEVLLDRSDTRTGVYKHINSKAGRLVIGIMVLACIIAIAIGIGVGVGSKHDSPSSPPSTSTPSSSTPPGSTSSR